MQDRTEETLDPGNWDEARRLGHGVIDTAIARLSALRDRPVWQPMPDAVRETFRRPLPLQPSPLSDVIDDVATTVLPYAMGNIHPRFWGWYMDSGNLTGAMADFLAAPKATRPASGR